MTALKERCAPMKITFSLKTVTAMMVLSAFCAVPCAFADDDGESAETEQAEEGETEESSDGDSAAGSTAAEAGALDEMAARANAAAEKAQRHFHQLLRMERMVRCKVEVLEPRAQQWKQAVEHKFYPHGSTFKVTPVQTNEGRPVAVFSFGPVARLVATNAVEFATREVEIGEKNRVLLPRRGAFKVVLPRSLPKGLFQVVTPGWHCRDMAGDSYFDYRPLPDGDETRVCVVTGELALEGGHFVVPRMGPADKVVVRAAADGMFTSLRGVSGIFGIKLDQGIYRKKDFTTGETHDEHQELEYKMSPKCAVKIFRKAAKVGGRMVVSTMTMDADGDIRNRRVFAEGRYNVNSGELVVDEKAAKAAAEAAKANAELLSGQATSEDGGEVVEEEGGEEAESSSEEEEITEY